MSTAPLTAQPMFNAINGSELIEKILRDVRKNLERTSASAITRPTRIFCTGSLCR